MRGVFNASDLQRPPPGTCADAYDLCRSSAPPFLFNHSIRVFAWAVLLAGIDRVPFDRDVLYVASLLHDIGLTERFDGPACFELEGANAARQFAKEHGWDDDWGLSVAEAIRLHMQPRVTLEDGAEALFLDAGVTLDCSGTRLGELDPKAVALVLDAAPRTGFRRPFLNLLRAQATAKPGCTVESVLQGGLEERMFSAPFDDPDESRPRGGSRQAAPPGWRPRP